MTTKTKYRGPCPKSDSREQNGFWAPGGYWRVCSQCQEHFIGDKRAAWCADCAYGESNTQKEAEKWIPWLQ